MAGPSIIVAIIALAASTVAAVLASWSTYSIEKRKSIREAEQLLRKYQDPLLLAARDLQARLYNLLQLGILRFAHGTGNQRDALYIYTTFLVGQYFAWVHILQRQGQFIAFASGGKRLSRTHVFVRITNQITDLWNKELLDDDAWLTGPERLSLERWWSGRRNSGERAVRKGEGKLTPCRWWTCARWRGRRQHARLRDIESQDMQQHDLALPGAGRQNPDPQHIDPPGLGAQNPQQQDAGSRDTQPEEAEPGGVERQHTDQEDSEQLDAESQDAESQDTEPQDFNPLLSFVLWKDRQRAIGEIMTDQDKTSGERICMEYSEFRRRWKEDDSTLHTWFRGIPEGIQFLVDARYGVNDLGPGDFANSRNIPGTQSTLSDQGAGRALVLKIRLVRLQNLLVDLIDLLDEEKLLGAGGTSMQRLRVADFLGSRS